MRLLLDTHVALWAITGDARLPGRAAAAIADPENRVAVSAATIWEIAIKRALARGRPNDMPISGTEALGWFEASGYDLLPVGARHAAAVDALPPHHADPFDRILIAQAIVEPMRLMTADPALAAYTDLVELL